MPKGEAMARVTFATAFGHPLGPQQRLTSVFVPYRRVVPPILFDVAFVSDLPPRPAAARKTRDQNPLSLEGREAPNQAAENA